MGGSRAGGDKGEEVNQAMWEWEEGGVQSILCPPTPLPLSLPQTLAFPTTPAPPPCVAASRSLLPLHLAWPLLAAPCPVPYPPPCMAPSRSHLPSTLPSTLHGLFS